MNMKSTGIAVCFAAQAFAGVFAAEISVGVAGQATVERVDVDIARNAAGMAVFSSGDLLGQSGEPQIPWKAMRVLLPPNTDMKAVSCRMVSVEYRTLEGAWSVDPVPPILTLDQEGNEIEVWPTDKTIVDGLDTAIYSSNTVWPDEAVRLTGTGRLQPTFIAS